MQAEVVPQALWEYSHYMGHRLVVAQVLLEFLPQGDQLKPAEFKLMSARVNLEMLHQHLASSALSVRPTLRDWRDDGGKGCLATSAKLLWRPGPVTSKRIGVDIACPYARETWTTTCLQHQIQGSINS